MPHDVTKVLLGSTAYSGREVTGVASDPATFYAGLAVRRATTGLLQLASDSVAALIGVSLGRSLSDTKQTAVCRTGLGVPLRQKKYAATGTITIATFANLLTTTPDSVTVAGQIFTAQSGAATLGTATFRAATTDAATATSLAAQINAHAALTGIVTAAAVGAVVTVTASVAGTGGNALALVYTDNGAEVGASVSGALLTGGLNGPAVHGKIVYTNDAGLGCKVGDGDATATNASYNGGLLTGVDEDGNECSVALIDMPGGL